MNRRYAMMQLIEQQQAAVNLDTSRVLVVPADYEGNPFWLIQGTYPVVNTFAEAYDDVDSEGEIWLIQGDHDYLKTDELTHTKEVTIRGGFSGSEMSASQADPVLYPTNIIAESGQQTEFLNATSGNYDLSVYGIHFNGFHRVLHFYNYFNAVITLNETHFVNGNNREQIVLSTQYTKSYLNINKCVFDDNAGLNCACIFTNNSDVSIKSSIFKNNSGVYSPGSGGVCLQIMDTVSQSATLNVVNSLFHGNTSLGAAVILYSTTMGAIEFLNCTIANSGSNIEFTSSSGSNPIEFNNTIFVSDFTGTHFHSNITLTASHSRLPDLTEIDTDNGGNIDDDPQFVDAANDDYSLKHSSPCVETGDNSLISENYDLAGNTRKMVFGRSKVMKFNGSDNWINFGNVLNMGVNNFSILARLKSAINSNIVTYLGKAIAVGVERYALIQYTNLRSIIHISTSLSFNSNTSIPTNIFSSIMSVDRSGLCKLYLNGTNDGQNDISSQSASPLDPNINLVSGTYLTSGGSPGYDGYLNGLIYDAIIVDKAVTDQEVVDYNEKGIVPGNILFRCRYDDETSDVMPDESGNGYNGTVNGTKSGNISGTYFDTPIVDMGCFEL